MPGSCSRTYNVVMKMLGATAGLATAGYAVALSVSASDGPHGVEISRRSDIVSIVGIACCVILSTSAWMIDRAHRIAAERDIGPLVRAELADALDQAIPDIAGQISAEVSIAIEERMARVAGAVSARNAAVLREIVTGDIMRDVIDGAVGRAQRAGMILQAQSHAQPPVRRLSPVED